MSRPTILMEEEAILVYWNMIRQRMLAVESFLANRELARHRRRERKKRLNEEIDELRLRFPGQVVP